MATHTIARANMPMCRSKGKYFWNFSSVIKVKSLSIRAYLCCKDLHVSIWPIRMSLCSHVQTNTFAPVNCICKSHLCCHTTDLVLNATCQQETVNCAPVQKLHPTKAVFVKKWLRHSSTMKAIPFLDSFKCSPKCGWQIPHRKGASGWILRCPTYFKIHDGGSSGSF